LILDLHPLPLTALALALAATRKGRAVEISHVRIHWRENSSTPEHAPMHGAHRQMFRVAALTTSHASSMIGVEVELRRPPRTSAGPAPDHVPARTVIARADFDLIIEPPPPRSRQTANVAVDATQTSAWNLVPVCVIF
jgi:hypothetical protein